MSTAIGRRRIAFATAFALMVAATLALSAGSAEAVTVDYLAADGSAVDCAFGTPDGTLTNPATDIQISTDKDNYEYGENIVVTLDVAEMVTGPAATTGTEVWGLDYSIDGGTTVVEVANAGVDTNVVPASTPYDPEPLEFTVVAPASGSTVTIEVSEINTYVAALANTLNCWFYDGDPAPATRFNATATVGIAAPFGGAMTIDSVTETTVGSGTGQSVTTHARPGVNTINVSGTGPWTGALTVELCAVGASSGDASCEGAGAGSSDGSTFTGSIDVPSTATIGARDVVVSDGVNDLSAGITILGTRSVVLTPNNGGAGTNVSVTGANWDPNEVITLTSFSAAPFAGGSPTGSFGGGASDGSGNLSGSIAVDGSTAYIVGSEPEDNSPTLIASAGAAFTIAADQCSAGNDGTGSCDLLQNVTLEIVGGDLSQTRAGELIDLGSITLNGAQQNVSGAINNIVVDDFRGGILGWTLNATLTDLTNTTPVGGNDTIAASTVNVAPNCIDNDPTSGAEAAGPATTFTGTVLLCEVTAGEGGGSWTAGADINFDVPANQTAGIYTAVLTTTLS